MMSAVLLVENAVVKTGRLIVVPHSNESAFTHNAPSEGYPSRFTVKTPLGSRWFRYGDRLTNPVHQWPDPEIYVHYPSGDLQADFEVRNLDRAFPGRPDGGYTERVAYALTELVRKENACNDRGPARGPAHESHRELHHRPRTHGGDRGHGGHGPGAAGDQNAA